VKRWQHDDAACCAPEVPYVSDSKPSTDILKRRLIEEGIAFDRLLIRAAPRALGIRR
jgi:hypothetical protein